MNESIPDLCYKPKMAGNTDEGENDIESADERRALLLSDSNNSAPNNNAEIFEDSISACGFGKFHIIILFICGWAIASDSAEVQCISFVIPAACDLHLTSNDKGWLNAIIFVGMMIGGYGFGSIADIKGRRFVLVTAMTLNGICGLASSFTETYLLFLLLRAGSGIGVGAAMPVVFSYFTEFMPKTKRGPMIGVLACFWMLGNIVTSAVAWLVIPRRHLGGYLGSMFYGSWRIFVALCAIPSLSSAFLLYLLPESPKFLQKDKRYDEATRVFTRIYKTNHVGKKKEKIPEEIMQFSSLCALNEASEIPSEEISKNAGTLANAWRATKELFSSQYSERTIILLIIWFTLSFGFYGLWMWFPEIFSRLQNGESSCGHSAHVPKHNISHNLTCEEKLLGAGNEVYLESFLVALANLPGNIFVVMLINRMGRRQMMALSMVLSGICVLFFWLVTSRVQMIVMSCFFSGLSVAGWNSLDVISVEQYPTHLRSTAFGFQAGVGRIAAISGNLVFGLMVDVHCAVPLFTIAGLLVGGGLSALRLPRTDQDALT